MSLSTTRTTQAAKDAGLRTLREALETNRASSPPAGQRYARESAIRRIEESIDRVSREKVV
jgi:hypothetical protein